MMLITMAILMLSLVGNDFGNEIISGRYDALNGVVLLGDGNGEFQGINEYTEWIFCSWRRQSTCSPEDRK